MWVEPGLERFSSGQSHVGFRLVVSIMQELSRQSFASKRNVSFDFLTDHRIKHLRGGWDSVFVILCYYTRWMPRQDCDKGSMINGEVTFKKDLGKYILVIFCRY